MRLTMAFIRAGGAEVRRVILEQNKWMSGMVPYNGQGWLWFFARLIRPERCGRMYLMRFAANVRNSFRDKRSQGGEGTCEKF
jgi:hypothetical protein